MEHVRFEIGVPAPFRLDLTAWALRRRAHNALDTWDGGWWTRTVAGDGGVVALRVMQIPTPADARLVVSLEGERDALERMELGDVRRTVTRVLGLGLDLRPFYALAERDPRLARLARGFYGMRPPRFASVFEALVNAVACQQLSLDVGIHLLNRLARHLGSVARDHTGRPAFPTADQLAGADIEDLRTLGFSRAKATTLVTLGRGVVAGEVDLESLEALDDGAARNALVALPGIGRWSAEYTLLRGLGRLHVLPGDDVGAQNNLRRRFGLAADGGYDAVGELSRAWWPYGGLVYFHLLLDRLADGGYVDPSVDVVGATDVGRDRRERERTA